MEVRSKSPKVAAFLSLLHAGLGHAYNGDRVKALRLLPLPLVGFSLTAFLGRLAAPRGTVWVIFTLVALLLGAIYLAIPIDAYRSAKRGPGAHVGWGRWSVLLVLFIAIKAVESAGMLYLRAQWLEPYSIPTSSMAPTLWDGDRVYVDKHPSTPYRRGDLVILRSPQDSAVTYIKRIVGMPGDKVEVLPTEVRINDRPLPRESRGTVGDKTHFLEWSETGSYLIQHGGQVPQPKPTPVTVPADSVFVLGDFRDNSYDSRAFGPVPLANLKGKPLQVWMSYDRSLRRIRWERIGLVLSPTP